MSCADAASPLVGILAPALSGRRLASVDALLPGSIAVAFDGAPRTTLLVSIRPRVAGIALVPSARRVADVFPADMAALVRPHDVRPEIAALRASVERGRVIGVTDLAPGERAIVIRLADAPAEVLVVELFPRGGRIVAARGAERTVLASIDAPGAARHPLSVGGAYAPPRAAGGDAPPREALAAMDAASLARALAASVRAEAADAAEALARRIDRRLAKRREAIETAIAEAAQAPEFRRRAETLLAHLGRVPRGASAARLPDVYGCGEIEIALDASVSPRENAERLFRRARKLERSEPAERARLADLESLAAAFAAAENALAEARERADLAAIDDAARALARLAPRSGVALQAASHASGAAASGRRQAPRASGRAGAPRAPVRPAFAPRRFRTSEGWEVLVGRTNAENDYLTHRLARPDDLWLHVHGAAGSHVVLRREGRKSNPSRRTIEEAAAIAAYFSKAKHASKVPVIYTEARYVRKPRGAPPGLATCTREKTVMVAPREPSRAERIAEADDDADRA